MKQGDSADYAEKYCDQLLDARAQVEGAMTWLVAEEHRWLLGYVRRNVIGGVGGMTTAEDLAQETMVRALRAVSVATTQKAFRAWLGRIARNAFIEGLRRGNIMRVEERADATELPVEERTIANVASTREVLGAARRQLSFREDAVIVLRSYQGLSDKKLGPLLGCRGAYGVRCLHARALRKLRLMVRQPGEAGI